MKAELSVIDLFFQAGPLVKCVMFILMGASLASWTFIFQRSMVLSRAKKRFKEFDQRFRMGGDLNRLYDYIATKREGAEGLENVFKMGFREFLRLHKKEQMKPEIIMESTERAMRVALQQEEEFLEEHLPFLASVGSISVYIGLFGTVWGIMTAFRALGSMQQATLAMVAPGISEALVATALGLFAAIPAVYAYNRLSQGVENLLRKYESILDEFAGMLQRQLYVQNSSSGLSSSEEPLS